MYADLILKYYWDIFIDHISEYYPLERSFIDRYAEELSWRFISKNRTLTWGDDFIATYQDKLDWEGLAINRSVHWTSERIELYNKKLKWDHLGQNPNVNITEGILKKYGKKVRVAADNPTLTNTLKEKHNIKIVPASGSPIQFVHTLPSDDPREIFKQHLGVYNEVLYYDKIFLPIIERLGLDEIFKVKFDYSQRYYFLNASAVDAHGITPGYEIKGINPFEVHRRMEVLPEIQGPLIVEKRGGQEGPDRLLEVLSFNSRSNIPCLLLSENVKAVLEKFKLPSHRFIPVTLVLEKLKTDTQYFIFCMEAETLAKEMEFGARQFHFHKTDALNRAHGEISESISDYETLKSAWKKVTTQYGLSVKIRPENYDLLTDYDLYSFSGNTFVVNEFLKEALEKNFPSQMTLKSAQTFNIKINQDTYDRKRLQYTGGVASTTLIYDGSEEVKYYTAKKERLEIHDPSFTINIDRDIFFDIQKKLNVVFPEHIKTKILNSDLEIDGFTILPFADFYSQNAYADTYPETFKSVVIAENGLGDSINLILTKESDFLLQDSLFEFSHESGDYQRCDSYS